MKLYQHRSRAGDHYMWIRAGIDEHFRYRKVQPITDGMHSGAAGPIFYNSGTYLTEVFSSRKIAL